MSEARTVEDLVDRLPRVVPTTAEYRTSQNVGKLFAALAKAQLEIKGAAKDATNPHFKSRYADLAAVVDAARPLAKHGIATLQVPFSENGEIGVTTILGHDSGEWISGRLSVKPLKLDPQGAGSVLTYLRRYSLAAMAGIAPEDDDGEAAMGRGTRETFAQANGHFTNGHITAAQKDELIALMKETGADTVRFLAYMNVAAIDEIPAGEFANAKAALEKKRSAKP